MKSTRIISKIGLALGAVIGLAAPGCQRPAPPPQPQSLLPAYTSNQIVDPGLRKIAEEIQTWAARQVGAGRLPLYSHVEVLAPAQTVQPYGVGAFQQELRLPVVLRTGPGWAGLPPEEKEAKVAQAFRQLSEHLQALKREPPLRPTLTVQTPQGMELAWVNHLDPNEKNVHGDD
jgi:hypothetical protein